MRYNEKDGMQALQKWDWEIWKLNLVIAFIIATHDLLKKDYENR